MPRPPPIRLTLKPFGQILSVDSCSRRELAQVLPHFMRLARLAPREADNALTQSPMTLHRRLCVRHHGMRRWQLASSIQTTTRLQPEADSSRNQVGYERFLQFI